MILFELTEGHFINLDRVVEIKAKPQTQMWAIIQMSDGRQIQVPETLRSLVTRITAAVDVGVRTVDLSTGSIPPATA
jgi:hypothetical protein